MNIRVWDFKSIGSENENPVWRDVDQTQVIILIFFSNVKLALSLIALRIQKLFWGTMHMVE